MTKVISFVNSKGGTGKTTLAFALATWWDSWGKHVLLIDTDPQNSLITLFGIRQSKGNMDALSIPSSRLESRLYLEKNTNDHDYILIDTPGSLQEIKPALKNADLVIIPIQPSGTDYFSFKRVFNVCMEVGAPTILVPNRIKTSRDRETIIPTIQALSEGRAPVATGITDRVAHRAGTVDGLSICDLEPASTSGHAEISVLASHIESLINGTKTQPGPTADCEPV